MRFAVTLNPAGELNTGTDPSLQFLQAIGRDVTGLALRDVRAVNAGERSQTFGLASSIVYRVKDGRVLRYSSDNQAERSFGRRRDVELLLNTEPEVRAKAQRLLVALGLDGEFEIEEIRLDPEEISSREPSRMRSFGTAHVQGRRIGDPMSMKGRNRWTVAYDRWDGAVLFYGLVDSLRFINEPGDIGEAGARRATEHLWAAIDADDPTQYPAEWRRVSSVQKGWCIAGPQWVEQYRSAHGREPEIGAILQAYKVSFSNPFWPGQDEFDYVFLRASNGELMHDGRF
ncbi:MAG: hypothetical protein IT207_04825 [Fimbriimonadaceae bacterium]|nr:hypothetical protein [Fimbriimonadaceae bacterium]